MSFKNVFISYGRRESLGFVGRLHRALKLAGIDGWFDKVNIPDGDDYALRIANGIENAQNFIYVMAPRCMKSPYCLVELEQARIYGKRIIPVNQMVIFDCEPKPLSEGDKAVMTGFYKTFNIPDQKILTEADVVRRTQELLGRTDWVYAREELAAEDIQALFEWQAAYENTWKKHDDLDFLAKNPLPIFGKIIDPFDDVVSSVFDLIEKYKEHVFAHTFLLEKALEWKRNHHSKECLLVGTERKEAEAWLIRKFKAPEQPPCYPSIFHIELICESKKNAENLFTDVFISYSRKNTEFCALVNRFLMTLGITTWVDLNDIEKGKDYVRAIDEAIENSAHYIFLMSPDSVHSKNCIKELEYALLHGKHIIPILILPTPLDDIPSALRHLQHIDFTDNEKHEDLLKDIDDLADVLLSEHTFFEAHRTYLAQALKWENSGRKQTFLLRGFNLDNAWNWLRAHQNRGNYAPLPLHHAFIQESYDKRGQLDTEVFISYSRKDADFARKLNLRLQQNGKTTWFDQESISEGADFDQEIFKGILQAETFLFVISPYSVESEFCERELRFAAENGKKFVPILLAETKNYTEKLPSAYKNIQWTDFAKRDFEAAFPILTGLLETDKEHISRHTRLQIRADEWQKNNFSKDYLLNASACDNAEEWLNNFDKTTKKPQPAPTDLQRKFIAESRKIINAAEEKEKFIQRKLQLRLRLAIFISLVAVASLFAAVYYTFVAKKNKELAEQNEKKAEVEKLKAIEALENLQKEKRDKAKIYLQALLSRHEEIEKYGGKPMKIAHEIDSIRKNILHHYSDAQFDSLTKVLNPNF